MSKAERYQALSDHDYDLFVIGAGSGGVRCSRVAAEMGARVAVAEDRDMGGTCVNVGCIPKKLMVYASHLSEEIDEAVDGYGWSVGERSFDWPTFIANKDEEILRLNGIYSGLLDRAGVETRLGRATLVDRHTVEIGGERLTARYIVIATGSRPFIPPEIPGIEHGITSDEIFHLDAQPRRIAILGGGYIATEFACIMHGLGSEVVQLYRGPLFLRGFDDDIRTHLAEQMRGRGIDLRFDAHVDRSDRVEGGLRLTVSDGSVLESDAALVATGRTPNSANLGLETVGVETMEDGTIVVDEYSRTSIDNIYAIGDVTNRINLTPVALHEGICLANTLFANRPMKPSHENVPAAVFSQPPCGTVGLTEAEARARLGEVDVYRSTFRALKQTLTSSSQKSMMKLVVDRASDRVVGLHMVGPEAGEITQGFAVAIKAGLTKAQFDDTIGIHPTAAEEFVTMREPVT